MKYYKEILLIFISTALCLGALEIFVRLKAPQPGPSEFIRAVGWTNEDYKFLHVEDARFKGWMLKPNIKMQHLDHDNQEYNYSIATGKFNELGYRKSDDVSNPATCSKSLWNLGDSFAFGFGVEPVETYAALLSESNGCSFNLGVPGLTLSQELKLFEYHYAKASNKPTQITIAVFWGNDVLEEYTLSDLESKRASIDVILPKYDLESMKTDLRLMHLTRATESLELKLMEHSHLYRWIAEKIYLAMQKGIIYLEYGLYDRKKTFFPTGLDSVDVYRQSWITIEHFLSVASDFQYQKFPVQFTYILIPSKEMILNAKAHPEQRKAVNAIGELFASRVHAPNLKTIDLFEDFAREKEFMYFNRDSHLNKFGHKLVYQKLLSRIQDNIEK